MGIFAEGTGVIRIGRRGCGIRPRTCLCPVSSCKKGRAKPVIARWQRRRRRSEVGELVGVVVGAAAAW